MKKTIYDTEIQHDPDIMHYVWINYAENRNVREAIARKQWLQLYGSPEHENAETTETSLEELACRNLEKFSEFTKDDKELSSNLLSHFFRQVHDSYSKIDTQTPEQIFQELKSKAEELSSAQLPKSAKRTAKKASSASGAGFDYELDEFKKLTEQMRKLRENSSTSKKVADDREIDADQIENLIKQLANAINQRKDVIIKINEEFDSIYEYYKEVHDVFGVISSITGSGVGFEKGMLKRAQLDKLQELSRLVERIKELRELIELLGRMKQDNEQNPETILYDELITERIPSPRARTELYGIHRSDDLFRLLPIELSNFTSSERKKLFFSRFLEKQLLTYSLYGEEEKKISKEKSKQKQRPAMKKGPIIVCVDTSGSMQGTPEMIAKATTLMAMKTALRQKRDCYAITFSSSNQTEEYELSNSKAGIENALDFLMKSFDGGTDFDTPIRRALEISEKEKYERADILMVSDGDGRVSYSIKEKIDNIKKSKGLRVFTFRIGSGRGLEEVSDDTVTFFGNKQNRLLI